MKLTSLPLIGALAVGGYAYAQTQPAPASGARGQEAVHPACKEPAQRMPPTFPRYRGQLRESQCGSGKAPKISTT
jgi:hypothetical protein